jgi:predicted lysophospholipase L1 biosynthesis ABC-type transport system permease subunit
MRRSNLAARKLIVGLAALHLGAAQLVVAQDLGFQCPTDLELLVERSFAARANLVVGSTLRIGDEPSAPCRATVAGTFEPPADPATLTRERPRLLLHLPDLGRLAGRPDEVDRFTVLLRSVAGDAESGAATDSVARLIGALMPGAQVLGADELAERSSATFRVIQRFHVAIAWITLSASGVFLACLMTLRVQQRRIPVAALRLGGISRRTLFLWLMLETTLISLLGAVAGLGIGHLASDAINAFYQRQYDTSLLFSLIGPDATIPALVLAVVLGLGAGGIAAALLLHSDPLEAVGR